MEIPRLQLVQYCDIRRETSLLEPQRARYRNPTPRKAAWTTARILILVLVVLGATSTAGLAYTLQVVRYLQVRPAPSEHQKILRVVPVIQDSSPRTVLALTTAPTELPTRLPATTISVLTMRIGVPTSLKILRRLVEPTEL